MSERALIHRTLLLSVFLYTYNTILILNIVCKIEISKHFDWIVKIYVIVVNI